MTRVTHLLPVDGDTIMVEEKAPMRLKGGRLGPKSAFFLASSLVTPACRSLVCREQRDRWTDEQSTNIGDIQHMPATAVPESRISLVSILALPTLGHFLLGETG